MSAAEDVQSWASREGLSDGTVQALADEGFTSLDDIKLLSAEEVTESFQKTKLLLLKECLALKKAIAKLSLGDSTAAPVSPSAPSASSPTGRSFQAAAPQYGHGRDQPDFGSTMSGVRAPSCDRSGGNFQCCRLRYIFFCFMWLTKQSYKQSQFFALILPVLCFHWP